MLWRARANQSWKAKFGIMLLMRTWVQPGQVIFAPLLLCWGQLSAYGTWLLPGVGLESGMIKATSLLISFSSWSLEGLHENSSWECCSWETCIRASDDQNAQWWGCLVWHVSGSPLSISSLLGSYQNMQLFFLANLYQGRLKTSMLLQVLCSVIPSACH